MDKKKIKTIFAILCALAGVIFIISVITRQFIINIISFILIVIADKLHKKHFLCPNCGKPLGSIKRRACPFCDYDLTQKVQENVMEAEAVEVDMAADSESAEADKE